MSATLAPHAGRHGMADRQRIGTLSNAGQAWRTSTGSLSGSAGGALHTGQLPAEWVASARAATYVIRSYRTPIAWRIGGEWVRPDIRYSATTSRHQSITRTYL